MVVKAKNTPLETLRKLLKQQNGILRTSDLQKHGIARVYLANLERNGEIERVSRGIYSTSGSITDEMAAFQIRYKGAIFSHETASYLLGLTDRTPLFYSVTVPTGHNATSLKGHGIKAYYVNRSLYQTGMISLQSPHGNMLKTFNLERTICDLLRNRRQIDIQQVNEALKRYVEKKDRNLNQLYKYARLFRLEKIVRQSIEALL